MSQAIGNPRLAYMRLWHHADASGRILGKFAARIANVLMGKHKPTWHPSLDYGDYVVVTNVRKLVVTGNKAKQVVYRHHTMFPGGLHERKYRDLMNDQPEEILRLAVTGMLPKNTLRDRRLERLKIFQGDAVEGGLAGNLTSSWGGSLQERRGVLFAPSEADVVLSTAVEKAVAEVGSEQWRTPLDRTASMGAPRLWRKKKDVMHSLTVRAQRKPLSRFVRPREPISKIK